MRKLSFEEVKVGDKTSFTKTITEADIFAFCGITGDFNPLHVNKVFAANSRFKARIAHGMMIAALVNQPLTDIMGEGTVHVSQQVTFKAPVMIGDTITVTTEVAEKIEEKRRVFLNSTWTNQDGVTVVTGRSENFMPRQDK